MDLLSTRRKAVRGANSTLLRNHNERMVLSHLRIQGPSSGSEVAKSLNVSAQTASVILRALEEQGFVERLEPVKGKVGKPQVPVTLSQDGAYAIGMRIGRRGADLALVDFFGNSVAQKTIRYAYPTTAAIDGFARRGIASLIGGLSPDLQDRVVGIGIAAPYELWNWVDALGATSAEASAWRLYRFEDAFAEFTDLPVALANDVNVACTGELLFGTGASHRDFGYFYIGAFIGGAVVLDGAVFHGRTGNAGALGSIPVAGPDGKMGQLIESASIVTFERQLSRKIGRVVNLRAEPEYWQSESSLASVWLEHAAASVANAAVAVAAVLDLSDIVIDGVFPDQVRSKFVARTVEKAQAIDQQGIRAIKFHQGQLGPEAGVRGAAYQPILTGLLSEGSALA